MSPGGRTDEVAGLRDAITRIERDDAGFSRRAARHAGRVTLGAATALDRMLRGGLGRGALHEVVAASPGDAAAASGFALALAARFAREMTGVLVWILEDHAAAETGAPYAPGLAAHGIDPGRLVIVATASGADTLWAMEEALKCRAVAAVVADLWRIKPYDLVASRRLVLTAQKSGTPGLVVPAGAAGLADRLSSAARARFEVRASPSPRVSAAHAPSASAGHAPSASPSRPLLPGCAAWDVRLARIRAGPSGAPSLDRERFWPVLWDHEEACLRDAFPLPLSAPARHGPDPAAPARRRA